MRKIHLLNESKQGIGGGWTFLRNFRIGLSRLEDAPYGFVGRWQDADIVLLPGATMASRETVKAVVANKKKLILRVDNALRNSRNRNTGMSRMGDFGRMADIIVWQSRWAADYLEGFIGNPNGAIIYNGIDTRIFNPDGLKYDFRGDSVYLYSRYSRDETKRWEQAWWEYQMIQREKPDALLVIIGRFSQQLLEYGFDFFMNERFQYMGVIDNPREMAKIYRGCNYLLAVYSNDCYSNTYQEAMACGVRLVRVNESGGTPELIKVGVRSCEDMVKDYLEVFEEVI